MAGSARTVYVVPPADGIWDFDFIATAPTGPSLQVISPIAAEPFMAVLPPWCKGVRVHASCNAMESDTSPITLDAESLVNFVPFPWGRGPTVAGAALAGDDLLPWPWKSFEWQVNPANSSTAERVQKLMGTSAGKALRVYHEGDMLTMDHRLDRCNVGLSKTTSRIVEAWIG